MLCSQSRLVFPGLDRAPEGSGRWKHQPWESQAQELFFTRFLTGTLAVMCQHFVLLSPPRDF